MNTERNYIAELSKAPGSSSKISDMTVETDPPKILIVDDITDNLDALESIFGLLSLKVDRAVNGLDAVEKFRQRIGMIMDGATDVEQYKLIMMDYSMPEMDGV